MTSPLSLERATWVRERIQLLGAMYTELMTKPMKYQAGEHRIQAQVIQTALHTIQAEKLALLVELEVLHAVHNRSNT